MSKCLDRLTKKSDPAEISTFFPFEWIAINDKKRKPLNVDTLVGVLQRPLKVHLRFKIWQLMDKCAKVIGFTDPHLSLNDFAAEHNCS